MIEVVGGLILGIAWAGFVFWGLAEMALAEATGNHQYGSPLLYLTVGAALGAGVPLFFPGLVLHYDTTGLGALLMIAAAFCIWVGGCSIRHPHWFRGPH